MEPCVLDTDVASFLFKGDARAELYRPLLSGRLRVLSFMTVAEMHQWAESKGWGEARRLALDLHLNRFVVVQSDVLLCRAWAEVRGSARRAGRPIQTSDAWIAATAVRYGLPLATHNPKDFAGVAGLRLLTA